MKHSIIVLILSLVACGSAGPESKTNNSKGGSNEGGSNGDGGIGGEDLEGTAGAGGEASGGVAGTTPEGGSPATGGKQGGSGGGRSGGSPNTGGVQLTGGTSSQGGNGGSSPGTGGTPTVTGGTSGGTGGNGTGGTSSTGGTGGTPTACTHPAVVKDCKVIRGYGTAPLCLVPAGCYTMGEQPGAICSNPLDWRPRQERVRSLLVEQVEGGGPVPSGWSGWNAAAYRCNEKTKPTGLESCYTCDLATKKCKQNRPNISECSGFRLLTEAEWEYAYRAGTTGQKFDGKELTHCSDGSGYPPPLVDENAWGLIGMHGRDSKGFGTAEWVNELFFSEVGGGPGEYTLKGGGGRAAWRGYPGMMYTPGTSGGKTRCVVNHWL